jgi:hypothetical protein
MAAVAGRRTALLIVRAWLEGEGDEGLRVRVTHIVDDQVLVSHSSSIQDVERTVHEALAGLLHSQEVQ